MGQDQAQTIKNKLDFLYKAIDDAQNAIRFTDTKAAAIMAFWAVLITGVINTRADWYKWLMSITVWYDRVIAIGLIVLLVLFWSLSVWLVFISVNPKTAPNIHIDRDRVEISGLFFLHGFKPEDPTYEQLYLDDTGLKLSMATNEYVKKIERWSDQNIRNELIFELQKVSYIRNIKIKRVNTSMNFVLAFLITLGCLVLFGFLLNVQVGGNTMLFSHVQVNAPLFIVLYIAHKIGDYLFQTDKQAIHKSSNIGPLIAHCLVYTTIVLGAAWFFIGFFRWAAVILLFFSHLVLDKRTFEVLWAKVVKRIKDPNAPEHRITMMELDQAFHYVILFIICLM